MLLTFGPSDSKIIFMFKVLYCESDNLCKIMQREGLDTRMAKIAIVTDSNSGITQAEGKQCGIYVLPMPFMIDEVTYYEDIDLTQEQFYEKLKSGANIATSQPSPDSVTSLWDKLLQEYDEIVHIPMSSGLSGSCQSAMAFAAEYDGRVQVVNNQRISVTQRQSALDALQLAATGKKTRPRSKNFLENDKFNSSIYIMLDTLYYLKKVDGSLRRPQLSAPCFV